MTDTTAEVNAPRPVTLESLMPDRRRAVKESAIKYSLVVTALVSVAISVLIIWSLFSEAWTFIVEVDWSVVWGSLGWFPRRGLYDMPTLLIASLITTAIAMVVATPLGLGAAVFLSEYANPRLRKILKPILEILASIPSVVLGYFALVWIAPNLIARLNSEANAGSLAAAGVGVGILTIPLIASISEDALKAVPNSLREASAGIGARRMTTTLRVVIPAGISGLVAAFIVATSRAIGETMVVFIAGGAGDTSVFTTNPFDGGMTMTAAMASLASGTDQVVGEGLTFQSLFFVGLVLFFMTLSLNLIADRFVARFREAY